MTDSNETREGRDDQSAGKLKEAIGDAAGNRDLEAEGRVQQAEGEMEEGLGKAKEEVNHAAGEAREALKD